MGVVDWGGGVDVDGVGYCGAGVGAGVGGE